MAEYVCKLCGETFRRRGRKPAVFCSLKCKGDWQRGQKPYNKDWLYKKYVTEGLSAYQIAKTVKRNPKRVYEWLRDYDIPLRTRKWSVARNSRPYHDKQWLLGEYVQKGRSTTDIAAAFGVQPATIVHFLNTFSIPRRSISEVRQIKYWGACGPDNPMFGRTGELSPAWKGGITPERQALYRTEEWERVANEVWLRDEGICQRCGKRATRRGAMHVHHIVSFAVPELRTEGNNLILLCPKCHHWAHSANNVMREFLGEAEYSYSAG